MTDGLFVIGFEGSNYKQSDITYGAAAFRRADKLINAVTKFESPIDIWSDLVKDGHITECIPKKISDQALNHKCHILRARGAAFVAFNDAASKRDSPQPLDSWIDSNDMFFYFLFDSLKSIHAVARPAAARLFEAARTLDPWDGKTQQEWLDSFAGYRANQIKMDKP